MAYYVGQVEDENETPNPDSGIGAMAGQAWADITRSALMPGCVTPTTSVAAGGTSGESKNKIKEAFYQSQKVAISWLEKASKLNW